MNENGRNFVDANHRESVERESEQKDRERELVEEVFREALEHFRQNPTPTAEPPRGVLYTELPEAKPGHVFFHEWNAYCREVGRLLAEGHEGRHVLIKGDEIIGVYDTWDEARVTGLQRYLLEPFFVHPIRVEEPYLRVRGLNYPWPNSRFQ